MADETGNGTPTNTEEAESTPKQHHLIAGAINVLLSVADELKNVQVSRSMQTTMFATPQQRVMARIDAIIADVSEGALRDDQLLELIELFALLYAYNNEGELQGAPTPGVIDDSALLRKVLDKGGAVTNPDAEKMQAELQEKLAKLQERLGGTVGQGLNQLPRKS